MKCNIFVTHDTGTGVVELIKRLFKMILGDVLLPGNVFFLDQAKVLLELPFVLENSVPTIIICAGESMLESGSTRATDFAAKIKQINPSAFVVAYSKSPDHRDHNYANLDAFILRDSEQSFNEAVLKWNSELRAMNLVPHDSLDIHLSLMLFKWLQAQTPQEFIASFKLENDSNGNKQDKILDSTAVDALFSFN